MEASYFYGVIFYLGFVEETGQECQVENQKSTFFDKLKNVLFNAIW